MEKNPYKFSQTNERLVVGVQKPGMVAYGTAAVFNVHLTDPKTN